MERSRQGQGPGLQHKGAIGHACVISLEHRVLLSVVAGDACRRKGQRQDEGLGLRHTGAVGHACVESLWHWALLNVLAEDACG